ncbi:hypothetical protein [Desulfofustis glycolicus]|jgi:hypothetical protein|uniref:Uncharacterized protein n=1 Tax=Desulfofustis glycolicus DSM 9705 TaxID=1121409 RepID=A0A1M5S5H7_9BACT|nr:hypothetical protein [Desulfofustis glycolicus]SHH33729.1 hypothetical protein SAMN02745124_00172 [Desulfofustis glycolicus DSM 9705]
MRTIWIPEPLYRAWPWLAMLSGSFFAATAPTLASLALGVGLVVYGAFTRLARY